MTVREQQADDLMASGHLSSDWRASFLAVPRRLFIPDTVWLPDRTRTRTGPDLITMQRHGHPERWRALADGTDFVITQVDDGNPLGGAAGEAITSSASMPQVVALMLQHRVPSTPDNFAVWHHYALGSSAQLKAVVGGQTIVVRPTDPARLADAAAILGGVSGHVPESPSRGVLTVPVDGDAAFTEVVAALNQAGIRVIELSLRLPSLDEVFFTLTGHTTAAAPESRLEVVA